MAVKPVRTQAKQVASYINGMPTRRIQTFDWASNYTVDSVFEMGNAGIVEDAVTLVETGITANSNEWGTTDLEALLFGIYEQRPCVGDNTANSWVNTVATIFVAQTGAGGDWTTNGNATIGVNTYLQVFQYNAAANTNTTEIVKVSAAAASRGQMVITLNGTIGRLTAACATSDIVAIVNKYTITQDTVDANPVHIMLPHRLNNTATTIMNTFALPRAFVDNLTYNLDTGGASEQNYTLVGEEEKLFLNAYREMNTTIGSFMGYNSTTGSLTYRVPLNGDACLGTVYATYAGSEFLKWTGAPGGTINHGAAEATVHSYIGANLGIDSTTQIVHYHYNQASRIRGFKALNNVSNTIGKLTKGFITVDLGLASTTDEKLARCTGIGISIPLTRETVDELGTSRSVAKPLEGNLRNEITLTFNRNNLREYAKLIGKATSAEDAVNNFDSNTLNEILMDDLKVVKTARILVKFYSSQTTHDSTTLLKTMTFTSCNFIGDNSTTPLTGAAGLEITFSTQSLSFVGSGLPPVFA